MAPSNTMRLICALACLLLSLLICCTPTADAAPITVTDSTFDETLEENSSLLLLFKANACPHCKRMGPDYERLSEDDDLEGHGVAVATIDVPSNRGASLRFGIRGFPTLIYFHNGRLYRYQGKRKFIPIKSFVMKGYENHGEGEEIPPKPTFLSQFYLIGKAVWVELYDAARGKQGKVGYLMLGLIGILMGVLGMFVIFLFMIITGKYGDDVDTKVKDE